MHNIAQLLTVAKERVYAPEVHKNVYLPNYVYSNNYKDSYVYTPVVDTGASRSIFYLHFCNFLIIYMIQTCRSLCSKQFCVITFL